LLSAIHKSPLLTMATNLWPSSCLPRLTVCILCIHTEMGGGGCHYCIFIFFIEGFVYIGTSIIIGDNIWGVAWLNC
jgi:hypothetical protein